jgi:hypothetical protein
MPHIHNRSLSEHELMPDEKSMFVTVNNTTVHELELPSALSGERQAHTRGPRSTVLLCFIRVAEPAGSAVRRLSGSTANQHSNEKL